MGRSSGRHDGRRTTVQVARALGRRSCDLPGAMRSRAHCGAGAAGGRRLAARLSSRTAADDGPTAESASRGSRRCDGSPVMCSASPARLRALGVRRRAEASWRARRITACRRRTGARGWSPRTRGAPAIVGGAIDKAPSADGSRVGGLPARLCALHVAARRPGRRVRLGLQRVVSARRTRCRRPTAGATSFTRRRSTGRSARRRAGAARPDDRRVRQHRDVSLRDYLPERREHGRIFAVTRVARRRSPHARAFALTALLLPPVILLRVRRVLAARGAAAGPRVRVGSARPRGARLVRRRVAGLSGRGR